jgi:hypothetical protein
MSVNPITLIAILIGGYVVLRVTVGILGRLRPRDDRPVNYDFTMGELNELLRRGALSPQEFEKARASVLKRAYTRAMQPFPPEPLPPQPLPTSAGRRGFEIIQKPDAGDSSRDAR